MLMRLKIGTRLGLAFGALLLLLVIMAGVGLKTMQEMSGYTEQLSNTSVRQMANASMILREMLVQTRYMRNFLLKPADQREGELGKLKESEGAYGAIVTRTEAALYAPRGKALFAAIKAAQARTLPIRERVITLAQAGKVPEASGVLYRELTPAAQEWEQAITAFRDFQIEQATLRYQTSESARKAAAQGIYVLAFLALGTGIALAVFITRSITGPVKGMVESLEALAEGDLTRDPTPEGRDELAQMAEALAATLQSLRTTLGQVQESAGVVSGAAAEISAGNNDLSRRTEQQAASLEETASTLEEFTSTIAQTNQNTRGATATTSRAQGIASQGSDEVGRLVAAMGDINRSSERIAEIIGVVDEIAFQTNLLALNAAVEAARAGEQGRGFAVVASEVRNLAKRSADAAREIKGLIQDSVAKASSGSKVAEGAGRTMKDVVGGVAEVTVLMEDISRASEEQTRGIQEIQKAVAQMDSATQQNAALVEEAAAAAESLNEQAGNLMDLLRKFKIGSTSPGSTLAPGGRSRVTDLRRPALRMTGS